MNVDKKRQCQNTFFHTFNLRGIHLVFECGLIICKQCLNSQRCVNHDSGKHTFFLIWIIQHHDTWIWKSTFFLILCYGFLLDGIRAWCKVTFLVVCSSRCYAVISAAWDTFWSSSVIVFCHNELSFVKISGWQHVWLMNLV